MGRDGRFRKPSEGSVSTIKALGAFFGVTIIWVLAMLVSCVMTAIPIAIGLTIIALFGRAIGAF